MEKPYLGMLGYTAEGHPFLLERGVDVKDAKEHARKNDLSEYILIPRGDTNTTISATSATGRASTRRRRPPASPCSATC